MILKRSSTQLRVFSIFSRLTVIIGCWFHYTKALYDKIGQKLGLCNLFKYNKARSRNGFISSMSLPFFSEEDIHTDISRSGIVIIKIN